MKKSRRLSETCRRMYLEGRMDEDFVMKAVTETLGGECVRASREDDMFKHIDFYWQSPKKGIIAIDVKGIKKNKRSDNNKDDSIHWIEMKNVRGNDGWVYGKSDYIAFLTKKQILFVKLDTLRKFAEEKSGRKGEWPLLFNGDKFLGNMEDIEYMNEDGELAPALK